MGKSGQGQFHQIQGQPILEQILKELHKDPKLCITWIADHSMPAEIFLGEVSKKGVVDELINKYGDPYFLSMVGILSLLELNCLTLDKSAMRQMNAQIIAQIIDTNEHPKLLSNYVYQRLLRLSASEMLLSKVDKVKQEEVEKTTQDRFNTM